MKFKIQYSPVRSCAAISSYGERREHRYVTIKEAVLSNYHVTGKEALRHLAVPPRTYLLVYIRKYH